MFKAKLLFSALFSLSCCAAYAKHDAIEYAKHTPNPATFIHVLTIDPNQATIIAARAQDLGHELCSVAELAQHYGAVAGVNGGYFRSNNPVSGNGLPAGILKITQWHGIAYHPRGAIGWDPKRNLVLFDMLQTKTQVQFKKFSIPVQAMNTVARGNRATLLSDSYIDHINLTNSLGLLIENNKITGIYDVNDYVIPKQAYLLNVSGTLKDQVKNLRVGDKALVDISIQPTLVPASSKQWQSMTYIVGGGPLLIHAGKKVEQFPDERMQPSFLQRRYARTAIGILPDQRWVLVVAEQSMLYEADGLTIPELQDFMFSLGCVAALNLDGGGSSAMYWHDKENDLLSNAIADAILVLPTKQ